MNTVFNEQILAEKLSKLDSSQQCIETLSHWCIFHRSKAGQVVSTWGNQFHGSDMVQKVSLLYLANDIMQNSKRKGSEFITEFWKVLPKAVKEVVEKGDDRGKNAVLRLVDIWEERRVFGSRARSIKDVMLGEKFPTPLEFGGKRSRSVKIVKRDSRCIRTKLTIGGAPEKIVTAFHLVLNEHSSEDEEINKCKSAVNQVKKMEEDVEVALNKAKDPQRKALAKELQDEENIIRQSVEKLKVVEANRVALVSQLREALHEQESQLESVRTQMQVAQAQIEESDHLRKCVDDENYMLNSKSSVPTSAANQSGKAGQTTKRTTAAIAAEVADKLASSSSSQYIMTSVLSKFAAEEAKKAGLTKSSTASATSFSSLPTSASNNSILKPEEILLDPNVFVPATPVNPSQNNVYQIPPAAMQGQMSNSQALYHSLLNQPTQQYLQPAGGTLSSYLYGSIPLLPPGPPPPAAAPMSYTVSPMPPSQHSLQLAQQPPLTLSNQPPPLNQLQPTSLPPQPPPPSFRPLTPMQPPGLAHHAQPHHTQ